MMGYLVVERKLKMTDYHAEIRTAIDQFELEHAQQLLKQALKNPDAETYYLAARLAIDEEQRNDFLQKALALNPFHQKAQQVLKGPANDDKALLVASIRWADTKLYMIPNRHGGVKAMLYAPTKVMPIFRTGSGNWIEVLYQDSKGTSVVGWLPKFAVGRITLDEQEISLMDLPVTNFELSNRNQLLEIQKFGIGREKEPQSCMTWVITAIVFFFIGVIGAHGRSELMLKSGLFMMIMGVGVIALAVVFMPTPDQDDSMARVSLALNAKGAHQQVNNNIEQAWHYAQNLAENIRAQQRSRQ